MNIRQEMLKKLGMLLNIETIGANEVLMEQAAHAMNHEFNALGSGWIRNHYGMQAPGFQGFNYSDTTLTAEKIRATVPDWYKARQAEQVALIDHYRPGYEPIDWQIDIKCGARYDIVHVSRIAFGKIEGMDAKVPSELSRFFHLVILARAWRATGNDEYRCEVIAQILDWLSVHPAAHGAGWRANMNVCIRIANLLAALAIISPGFDAEDEYDAKFLDILYESLVEHRRYVAEYLEFTEDPTCLHPNHYIADLSGLLLLSTFLSGCDPEALPWANIARREFGLTMRWQINPDGVDFESTTMYHAYATEMLVGALLLSARLQGADTAEKQREWLKKYYGEDFVEMVRSMFAALRDLIQPNRRLPVVGDNDSGRFLCLENFGGHDTDRVFFCGVGAALFEDEKLLPPMFEQSDWAYAAAIITGLPCAKPENLKPARSTGFRDSGFYVMRSKNAYSFVCCAPIGTAGLGAHSHNDRLEATLSLKGEDIIIDPGVYAYTASKKFRNMYRNVEAHSTVCIAGVQPNRLKPEDCWWGYRDDTKCECLHFGEEEGKTTFVGQHHAYERLDVPVTHRRKAELTDDALILEDSFIKDPRFGNDMSVEYTFMLSAGCQAKAEGGKVSIECNGVSLIGETACGEWIVEEGYYAPMYGAHAKTTRLRIRFDSFIEGNTVKFSW